jgi:hypothetical protein
MPFLLQLPTTFFIEGVTYVRARSALRQRLLTEHATAFAPYIRGAPQRPAGLPSQHRLLRERHSQ